MNKEDMLDSAFCEAVVGNIPAIEPDKESVFCMKCRLIQKVTA